MQSTHYKKWYIFKKITEKANKDNEKHKKSRKTFETNKLFCTFAAETRNRGLYKTRKRKFKRSKETKQRKQERKQSSGNKKTSETS